MSSDNIAATRILSLSLLTDEILLDLVPHQHIAALEPFVDDPFVSFATASARGVPNRARPNLESILVYQPDLVLMSPWSEPYLMQTLLRFGVRVEPVAPAGSLAEIQQQLERLGILLAQQDRAQLLNQRIMSTVDFVTRRTRGTSPVSVLSCSVLGPTCAGGGTLLSELVAIAGGRLIPESLGMQGFVTLSMERLCAVSPDVLVISNYRADSTSAETVNVFECVRAARRVHIDERLLTTTNHHVADLVLELGQAIHPELDWTTDAANIEQNLDEGAAS